jgi:hypothetical protein
MPFIIDFIDYFGTLFFKKKNLHKLWPHNITNKTNPVKIKREPAVKSTSQTNENEKQQSVKANPVEQDAEIERESTVLKSTKPSMCLINELVKFNKIKHEYVLLDEIGPAHKKIFFVALKLGLGTDDEESFTGNGTSIKKAQHSAAEQALKETKYKLPQKRNKPLLNQTEIENSKSDETSAERPKDSNPSDEKDSKKVSETDYVHDSNNNHNGNTIATRPKCKLIYDVIFFSTHILLSGFFQHS